MLSRWHRLTGALIGLAVLAPAGPARAQLMLAPGNHHGGVNGLGVNGLHVNPGAVNAYLAQRLGYNAAGLGLAGAGLAGPGQMASQFWGGGYANLQNNPTDPTGASLSTSPGYGGGGGGYGMGGYGTYVTNPYPFGDYMNGVAAMTNANAKYLLTIEQARLLRYQVDQARMQTQRQATELATYSRDKGISAEQQRERDRVSMRTQARRLDLPISDVLSARALNILLDHALEQQRAGARGPAIDLGDDLLGQINLTAKDSRGNPGLLRKDRLTWPAALEGERYVADRKGLEDLLQGSRQRVRDGQPVDPGDLKDMRSRLDSLREGLLAAIDTLTPAQYLEGKRYLNQLEDAIKLLEHPKAANFLNGTWTAKGKNRMAELIDYLGREGLVFAPAVSGDESAYQALHRKLADFESGMQTAAKEK